MASRPVRTDCILPLETVVAGTPRLATSLLLCSSLRFEHGDCEPRSPYSTAAMTALGATSSSESVVLVASPREHNLP